VRVVAMAQVFVSYAHEDRARIEPLVEAIRAQGLTLFWDRDIRPGGYWRGSIRRNLMQARCLVVVWSAASTRDGSFVVEEAEAYRQRAGGHLIPVCIDEVKPPFGFHEIQAADLTSWSGDPAAAEVVAVVAAVRDAVESVEPHSVSIRPPRKGGSFPRSWKAPAAGLLVALLAAGGLLIHFEQRPLPPSHDAGAGTAPPSSGPATYPGPEGGLLDARPDARGDSGGGHRSPPPPPPPPPACCVKGMGREVPCTECDHQCHCKQHCEPCPN
jgi:hypothetical protein